MWNFKGFCFGLFMPFILQGQWHQVAGPNGDFTCSGKAPLSWSVALNQNIKWSLTLPETGQSTPVIGGCKIYFSTLKPVTKDSTLGKDIIAWCVDAETGKILWQNEIEGTYPLRLSGCFSDSSAPAPVIFEDKVVFLNASGKIVCFDESGKQRWSRDFLSVGRTMPFLHEGKFVFTRQIYPPEPDGNFPHKYKDAPKEMWTQLQALDIENGEIAWTSECGVNMGMATMPQTRKDGLSVAVVGRGGGHGPPEKPSGISMLNLKDGNTLWTLPLDGFMATMSYKLYDGAVHIFHKGDHLSVDENTGKIIKTVSITDGIPVCQRIEGKWKVVKETLESPKSRMITQGSNLLIGNYHYFRSYVRPWLGRVDLDSGQVEYLEMPLQVSRTPNQKEELIWFQSTVENKRIPLTGQGIPNDMINSRGLKVVGDKRSHGSGWGHIASPQMTVAGDHLYVPIMNGTVFVIDWNAEELTPTSVLSICDLGPAGKSFTRASISFAGGYAYAHTIRQLICIGE